MKQARLRRAQIRLLQRAWIRLRHGGRVLAAFREEHQRSLRGLTATAGVLMIGYGAWLAYAPAGWIAAGLLLYWDMNSGLKRSS